MGDVLEIIRRSDGDQAEIDEGESAPGRRARARRARASRPPQSGEAPTSRASRAGGTDEREMSGR